MPTLSIVLVPVHADQQALDETESVLRAHHFSFVTARPIEEMRRTLQEPPPTLAILQTGPHYRAALDVLRGLQAFQIPTLALVDQLTDSQEATLLHSGALDVVGLPTSTERLTARILAMQRYTEGLGPRLDILPHEQYVVGDLTIDVDRREVCVNEHPVDVTKTEFDLLLALARHPGKVLTREELSLQALTGRSVGMHALESHISRLRSKILLAQGPRLIEPIRGIGYRLGA